MRLFDFFTGKSAPLIAEATEHLASMISQSHSMFDAACARLLDNEILDLDLAEADLAINESEQAVRRLVLEHVAIDPEHQMVFGLVLLTVVQDAERLGDLAKTIAEVAELAETRRHGPEVDRLRDLRNEVSAMFVDTTEGFVNGSIELSTKVMEANQNHKPHREAFIRDVATNDSIGVNMAVVLALGARLIGRTASHLSNIASGVAAPFDQIRTELNG